jgi:hypothetical protein
MPGVARVARCLRYARDLRPQNLELLLQLAADALPLGPDALWDALLDTGEIGCELGEGRRLSPCRLGVQLVVKLLDMLLELGELAVQLGECRPEHRRRFRWDHLSHVVLSWFASATACWRRRSG